VLKDELGVLIRRLYVDLGESTGGPLHWMLDDGNLGDEEFEHNLVDGDIFLIRHQVHLFAYLYDGTFDRYAQAGDDVSVEHKDAIADTCREIFLLLRTVPESERSRLISQLVPC
jgi:hypothetical protein